MQRVLTRIEKRTANIKLSKIIQCKRTQFPISEIWVHKSQSTKFDQNVFQYGGGQQHQLVYVALCRVTEITGFYMINGNCISNSIKGMAVVYHNWTISTQRQRLQKYQLSIITVPARTICQSVDHLFIIISNVQSLNVHAPDIETERILRRSDYPALTDISERDKEPIVRIKSHECLSQRNNRRDTENAAGGEALHRNLQNVTTCRPIAVAVDNLIRCTNVRVCDVCLTNATLDSRMKFVLRTVMFIREHQRGILTASSFEQSYHSQPLYQIFSQMPKHRVYCADILTLTIFKSKFLLEFIMENFKQYYAQNHLPRPIIRVSI
jgi:hypothetical protein